MLWLWHRPADANPIEPLAWEIPYAAGAALKSEKKNGEDMEKQEASYVIKPLLFLKSAFFKEL